MRLACFRRLKHQFLMPKAFMYFKIWATFDCDDSPDVNMMQRYGVPCADLS